MLSEDEEWEQFYQKELFKAQLIDYCKDLGYDVEGFDGDEKVGFNYIDDVGVSELFILFEFEIDSLNVWHRGYDESLCKGKDFHQLSRIPLVLLQTDFSEDSLTKCKNIAKNWSKVFKDAIVIGKKKDIEKDF